MYFLFSVRISVLRNYSVFNKVIAVSVLVEGGGASGTQHKVVSVRENDTITSSVPAAPPHHHKTVLFFFCCCSHQSTTRCTESKCDPGRPGLTSHQSPETLRRDTYPYQKRGSLGRQWFRLRWARAFFLLRTNSWSRIFTSVLATAPERRQKQSTKRASAHDSTLEMTFF